MLAQTIPHDLLTSLRLACVALDSRKAESVKIFDVRGISPVTDFLIIASGNSPPHLKALRNAVTEEIRDRSVRGRGAPDELDSGWIVIDAFDLIIHLFTEEQRAYYRLEGLYRDANKLEIEEILGSTPS
ncbi:MAG: ribosome silencing factor [Puniceicoccaceae bacterium]